MQVKSERRRANLENVLSEIVDERYL